MKKGWKMRTLFNEEIDKDTLVKIICKDCSGQFVTTYGNREADCPWCHESFEVFVLPEEFERMGLPKGWDGIDSHIAVQPD